MSNLQRRGALRRPIVALAEWPRRSGCPCPARCTSRLGAHNRHYAHIGDVRCSVLVGYRGGCWIRLATGPWGIAGQSGALSRSDCRRRSPSLAKILLMYLPLPRPWSQTCSGVSRSGELLCIGPRFVRPASLPVYLAHGILDVPEKHSFVFLVLYQHGGILRSRIRHAGSLRIASEK